MARSSWHAVPRTVPRRLRREQEYRCRCGGVPCASRRSDALEDRVAPAGHFFLVIREQRAAMRIHADQQRAEMLDLEAPQALRMQVVEIDVLDLLDPCGLQRRRTADDGEIGAAQFLERG